MNRSRLNLALLVLALGLGAAVFFSQKKDEKGGPLTALKPDAVTSIAIEHPGSPAIKLQKSGANWQLTAPVTVEADPMEVNAVLALADKETKQKLDAAKIKLAELKLDPPDYSITLNDRKIDFGTVEPLAYRRYVKSGDAVYLIDDPPSAALDADYSDLVAKSVLAEAAQVERVELPKLTLSKAADGKWQLTPPDPKASADQMQKLADAWKSARAMWNEKPKEPGKIKGDRVRVVLKDGTVREFTVAERDPQFKLYRADLGVSHVLSKALENDMLQLPPPPPPPPAPAAAPSAAPAPPAAAPAPSEPPKK